MRTLITILLMLFVSISPELNAGADETTQRRITAAIQQSISMPEEFRSTAGQRRVLVVFEVGGEGSVKVLQVGTQNENLKNHIQTQMEKIQLGSQDAESPVMYSMWLEFKTL